MAATVRVLAATVGEADFPPHFGGLSENHLKNNLKTSFAEDRFGDRFGSRGKCVNERLPAILWK